MDVYFQNMAIRSCDYASQAAINKSQKVIGSLVRISIFLKNIG